MAIEEGAGQIYKTIQTALNKKEGALIGRNGTIELETLLFRLYGAKPADEYPSHLSNRMELHAGIWPPDKKNLDKWVFQVLEAIRLADVLVAGWYAPLKEQELKMLNDINQYTPRIPLRSLEPYYVEPEKRWTQLLAGHKVAIVNAFAKTAIQQIKHREEIWPVATDSLLPQTTEWIPIVTGYAPVLAKGTAEWGPNIKSWDVAVSSTVRKVIQSGAKIAFIGCGGLGMIIGCELKKQGIIAIVLGGATQVLFGIKGGRWAKHDVISHFWNEAWVYPTMEETPQYAYKIEGGCYWGVG